MKNVFYGTDDRQVTTITLAKKSCAPIAMAVDFFSMPWQP